MTPGQYEARKARKRVANMTPEQIERERARHRVANRTPEQIEAHRARNRKPATPPPGAKHDAGKRRYDLLPISAIGQMADVLTHGARKYSDDGWRSVPNARRRYFAALMRHAIAWFGGERIDPESGLHHLAHALCNVAFLLEGDADHE